MNEEAREQLDQINVEEQTKKLQELRNLGIDPYGAVSYTHLDVYKRQIVWL